MAKEFGPGVVLLVAVYRGYRCGMGKAEAGGSTELERAGFYPPECNGVLHFYRHASRRWQILKIRAISLMIEYITR